MINSNDKVLVEENGLFQFDFSASEYVWELDTLTTRVMLSDVDFIS